MRGAATLALSLLTLAACGEPGAAAPRSAAAPSEAPEATPDPRDAVARLSVDGMVCEGCANAARACLEGVEGVHYVDLSFADAQATVRYDPTVVDPSAMVAALESVDRGEAPPLRAQVLEPLAEPERASGGDHP
ncbi:MAG: heavy metal-associated domain-containing protein [Sandaracinaceae bacterium]